MIMYAEIENDRNEQSLRALIATLIISVGILLLLMFINLYRPNPLPTQIEIILPLGLGEPDAGGSSGGAANPSTNPSVANVEPGGISEENAKDAPEINSPNHVTTNPVVNNNTKPNNKPNNPNALYPGGGTNGEGGGDKDGEGKGEGGHKGDGFGPNTEDGKYNPNKGDYVMEGRTATSKQPITDSFEEEGKVVINVWIDQNGAVTRTSINESQTNTSSEKLRRLAEKAAKKWKYSANSKAAVEQKGLVIYKFTLQ